MRRFVNAGAPASGRLDLFPGGVAPFEPDCCAEIPFGASRTLSTRQVPASQNDLTRFILLPSGPSLLHLFQPLCESGTMAAVIDSMLRMASWLSRRFPATPSQTPALLLREQALHSPCPSFFLLSCCWRRNRGDCRPGQQIWVRRFEQLSSVHRGVVHERNLRQTSEGQPAAYDLVGVLLDEASFARLCPALGYFSPGCGPARMGR